MFCFEYLNINEKFIQMINLPFMIGLTAVITMSENP